MDMALDLSEFHVLDSNLYNVELDNEILIQHNKTKEILAVENNVQDFFLKQTPPSSQIEVENKENEHNVQAHDSMQDNAFYKWTEPMTKFMLHKYAQYLGSIGPKKQFRTKKCMWNHIAVQLHAKFHVKLTFTQVESRYKCVMRRTKKNIDNNNKSGAVHQQSSYDDDVHEIMQQDDSIVIDTGLSPGYLFQKSDFLKSQNKSASSSCIASNSPKKNAKSQQIKLLEKYLDQKEMHFSKYAEMKAEREKRKNERHAEKMKILKSINDVISKN